VKAANALFSWANKYFLYHASTLEKGKELSEKKMGQLKNSA
jgi:hypothetical protein